MKDVKETNVKNKSAFRSGLYLSLPFLLCLVAIILLSVWGYNTFFKNNSKIRLMVSSYSTDDSDVFTKRTSRVKVLPDPEWTQGVLAAIDSSESDESLEELAAQIQVPNVMPKLHYGQKFGSFSLPRFKYYNRGLYNCDNPDVFGYYVGRALYKWLPGQGRSIVMCGHCVNSFIYTSSTMI